MRESLDEPVSVISYYDAKKRIVKPYRISWRGRAYKLGEVDFWHKTWLGNTRIHHFSLTDVDNTIYFKIALNTDTLQWTVEEYMYAGDNEVHYKS